MSNFTDLTADTTGDSLNEYDDVGVEYDQFDINYDGVVDYSANFIDLIGE